MKAKESIIIWLISVAVLVLIVFFRDGEPLDYVIVLISAGVVLLIGIFAYFCEKRWGKKTDKIAAEQNTREHQKKADEYSITHGFEIIKRASMKSDLISRFQQNGTLGFIFGGILLIVIGILPIKTNIVFRAIIVILGISLFAFGIYRLSGQPVRIFLKTLEKTGADISEINKDYLKGRLVHYNQAGICIGDKYTVCWNKGGYLLAVLNKDILLAQKQIQRVKHYSKGIFIGGDRNFQIKPYVQKALPFEKKCLGNGNYHRFKGISNRFNLHRIQ